MKLYEIKQSPIYVFHDGKFQFYTAYYGSWANDARLVFRVRTDTDPKTRAQQKDIKYYDRLIPSTGSEIQNWLDGHPDFKVQDIIM